jgi:hypothetical protein
MRRVFVAACLLAVLGRTTLADAHVLRINRTIDTPAEFEPTDHASGFLNSASKPARCEVGVRVELWDVEDSPPTIEGFDYTDQDGFYLIRDPEFTRDYQAIAPKVRFGPDNHHVCKRAVSGVFVDWPGAG